MSNELRLVRLTWIVDYDILEFFGFVLMVFKSKVIGFFFFILLKVFDRKVINKVLSW